MGRQYFGTNESCVVVLFALSLSAVTIESTELANMQIPRLQAESLWQLFIDRNVGIQLDLLQEKDSEAALFSVYGGEVESQLIFAIESSTNSNRILIKFRTRSGQLKTYVLNAPLNDGKWHRIIFALTDDQIQLSENCHQLIRKQDFDIHFEPQKHLRMFVEELSHHEKVFRGRLREFSADSGNPTSSKCPNLDLMLASPVITLVEEPVTTTTQQLEDITPKTNAPEALQRRNVGVEQSVISHILERVTFLEHQQKHWRSVIQSYDNRFKTIELHQRGCQVNGKLLLLGEKVQNLENCTECRCGNSGNLFCSTIGCAHLTCDHPLVRPGECCPICGKECLYNGEYYQNGHEFWPKSCVQCRCENGRMDCQFHQEEKCVKRNCRHQEVPRNQCCPVCVNEDFCQISNPCHESADCFNGKYGAVCKCKTGFFGNGTMCYDIDECLWDDSAREQLGGCRTGTACINLPGSFRCDCLPGFRKLDDRNCLDLIRI